MLTYCTNIHTGEGWQEVQSGIHANVPLVQRGLAMGAAASPSPTDGEPFPLSVWISGRAARELESDEAQAASFLEWCNANHCTVRSINGFPHGAFHGVRVKEQVYLPDWRDPERLAYTE